MTNRAAAARYARALFDVGLKEADVEQIGRDLSAFATLFAESAELRKALLSPAVPSTAKRAVIERITERIAAPKPMAKVLALLADRDRLVLVPDLAQAYVERLMEHQNVIRAEIVTAMPLDANRAAQVEQRLAAATGRTVTMSARVDPSILGGAVARVGSTVYDGSLAMQLAKMRERLTR